MTTSIWLPPVPYVTVDGTAITNDVAWRLRGLRVSRHTGSAGHAELRFSMGGVSQSTGDTDLTSMFEVGAEIAVGVTIDGTDTELFSGEIVAVGIELSLGERDLTVEAFDASYRLGQRTEHVSHLNQSPKDVITAMANGVGLTPAVDASLGSPVLEHIQQSGTPHEFLTDLARAYGCEWFITDGSTLVVQPYRTDATSSCTFSAGDDLRSFRVRVSGTERNESVKVRSWDSQQKADIEGTESWSAPEAPTAINSALSADPSTAPAAAISTPRRIVDATHAGNLAKGVMVRMQSSAVNGRGEVDVCPALVPGCLVTINDVTDAWSGEYYVTGVEHVLMSGDTFVTRFTVGPYEPRSIVDLLGRAATPTQERVSSGLSIGVVTDNEDPDGLGRVKVRLPYLAADHESWWARVVSAGAGADRGLLCIPEIEDEVIVAFEHGDLQRPYVLGGLWNGTDAIPTAVEATQGVDPDTLITAPDVTWRAFTSRAGHQLLFSDSDGKKHIRAVLDDKTTEIVLAEDQIVISCDGLPITVRNADDSKIEMADSGDVTITAPNITLDSAGELTLKSGGDMTIDAGANLAVDAGAQVNLKAGAPATLESSAVMTVKGAMVKIN